MSEDPRPLEAVAPAGNVVRGDVSGEGPAVIQAHGVTAARRYVTHGSKLLQRRGFRAVAYDARGHGESDPAPPGGGYTYAELVDDMGAVADAAAPGERVIVAGHSMGAHTATAFTLEHPERVAALVAISPASRGTPPSEETVAYWERLAAGLEGGGIEGFIETYDDGTHDPEWRDTVLMLARRRLALHRDLEAVARALREVTSSVPFEGMEALAGIAVPTLVVGTLDEADPGHPYAVAEEWAGAIPDARLISESPGESPLAWQGGKLSRAIADFGGEAAVQERLGTA